MEVCQCPMELVWGQLYVTGGLSWGWTASPGPYSCPCRDCIVSQACGNHRAWEGSCASQVHPKPTLSRFPLAPGLLVAPLPAFPQLCCSLRAEASGMCLGSEPASMSSRGLLPWLPAKPWVFRDIFWGGAGLILLSEARGAFSLRRTPGCGSSLASSPLPLSGSPVSCPRNPGLC